MQKITIVAHALSAGGGTSVGRNLILSLLQQLTEVNYQVFIPANLGFEKSIVNLEKTELHVYKKQSNLLKRFLYDFSYLEKKISEFKPDIVLCLGNRGVNYRGAKQFILCQDSHFFYPVKFYARETVKKKLAKWFLKRRLAQDLKYTDKLFVQTKVAAKRISEMFAYKGEIVILPNAVSVEVKDAFVTPDVPEVIQRASLKFKLFYLTRYYPHKNIELLVDLFDKYRDKLGNVCLFITIEETQHPLAKKMLSDIKERNLEDFIINLGSLSQSDLPTYFSLVDALVMPTTLESFSGTYLEAMRFSCPILTSDLDFAKDICADAALYFDPWSVESLFNAVEQLRNNCKIQTELQQKGRRRLQSLGATWDRNGRRLVSAILET